MGYDSVLTLTVPYKCKHGKRITLELPMCLHKAVDPPLQVTRCHGPDNCGEQAPHTQKAPTSGKFTLCG